MKKWQRGFTLIEMLIVLSIVGAVVATLAMSTTTLLLNYKQLNNRPILLQQAQNAGYSMSRDVQMSNSVTLSSPNGFPVSVNIPVDQDQNHDYHVDYLLDSDKLKRQQYDAAENLIYENVVAQNIDVDNTSFLEIVEDGIEGLYKLNIGVSAGGEAVAASYEARRRLTQQ